MATKVKTTAKKVSAKAETQAQKATTFVRRGALAYIGLYGAAYERAQFRFEQAREATDGAFDKLVAKGEVVEAQATDLFKDTQERLAKTYEGRSQKVRAFLPKSANDRVLELEAEIEALNKKIVTMSKKARKTVKAKTTTARKVVAEKAA